MAEMKGSSQNKDGPEASSSRIAGEAGKVVRDFVEALTDEQKMLVVLKRQLYDGSWETMLDDLRNRLAGKPYIFKLINRIQDDIERIEGLQKFEQEHNVDLADYVELT